MALLDITRSRASSARRPVDARLIALAGSLCIAFSPILIALSGASPGTATLFRCVLALPLLVPLGLWERRRTLRRAGSERPARPHRDDRRDDEGAVAGRPGRPRPGDHPLGRPVLVVVGGLLLGLDMTLWTASLHAVGAGVSTVLVNVQVVFLPLLAFLVLGERIRATFLLLVPVMLVGIALAGGLADGGAGGSGGSAPLFGTVTALVAAAAYAGYILLIRIGSAPGERFAPVALATAAAAASSAVVGGLWQGVDLTPGWVATGWLALLALVGQVMGWVLLATALPRLPSATGASILLLQPVGAVGLGMVVLAEYPSALQLLGCGVVIGSVVLATRVRAAGPVPPGGPGVRSRS